MFHREFLSDISLLLQSRYDFSNDNSVLPKIQMEINNIRMDWRACILVFRLKNTRELFATVYLSGVTTQIWICFVLFVERTELTVFIMRFCVF